MHSKRLAAAGFALVVALAACSAPGTTNEPGGSGNESQAQADDQVLRIPLGGEPATLDPNRASDSISITVLNQLVRPLVYFDPDLNTVSEGGLAEYLGRQRGRADRHLPPEGRPEVLRRQRHRGRGLRDVLEATDRSAHRR